MDKIAFLFAGQGAQYPGMGRSLYEASPAARKILDAAETARPGTLTQCFSGTAEELAVTANTQPCLFAVDCACAAALYEAGIRADAAAGFSLGEIAAVHFCGLLDFDTAFALVCRRAALMQAAAEQNPGAMSAILRLDGKTVEALAAAYDRVFPVNYNCPGQTVVAGQEEQLKSFEADVAANRGRAMRLKLGGGFHSPFMDSAAAGLADYMEELEFSAPRIPLYANATAEPYGDPRTLLAQQVKSPVLWQRTIEHMQQNDCTVFIELGAGKTLTGLMGKIGGARLTAHVEDAETLAATLAACKEAGIC
jgi:[acyl-carrier-protein] S-malonyltransferase